MMSMVDRLAEAVTSASDHHVVGMKCVEVKRWLPLPGPVPIETTITGDGPYQATLLAWREAPREELSRFEPVATTPRCRLPAAILRLPKQLRRSRTLVRKSYRTHRAPYFTAPPFTGYVNCGSVMPVHRRC